MEGVYTSVQGTPAVAHVLSNYYIGNLEPNTDYYTFCVAEDSRQIAMSTDFASTERHVVTLAGAIDLCLRCRAALPLLPRQLGDHQLHLHLRHLQRARGRLQLHRALHRRLRLPHRRAGQDLRPRARAALRGLHAHLRVARQRHRVRHLALLGGPQAGPHRADHRLHHLLHHHRLRPLPRQRRVAAHHRRLLRDKAVRARLQRRSPAVVRLGGRVGRGDSELQ